jgi:hypothetical protein
VVGKKDTWGGLDVRHSVTRHLNMRKAIEAKGMTRDGFAAAMGVNPRELDAWLDGRPGSTRANACMHNDELVRAARILGSSVWYLLDLTDETDGSGARPMECRDTVGDLWGRAKDPDKAAPVVPVYIWENIITGELYGRAFEKAEGDPWPDSPAGDDWEPIQIGEEIRAWRPAWQGNSIVAVTHVWDIEDIKRRWEDKCTGDPDEAGWDEATDGWESYLRWCRQRLTDRLRDDLLRLRGDFRDPMGVIRAELEHASKHPGGGEFDALLVRIDQDARAAIG